MKLNTLPKQYMKGKCLESGDKLRDLGNPTLSLDDYKAIMYKDMSNPEISKDDMDIAQSTETEESSPPSDSNTKITITKVYPWYLS